MKAMSFGVIFGVLFSNFAFAAVKRAPFKACESQASATFKKRAVEVELASIVGNLSELEASSERDGLQKRLDHEKAHCLRVANSGNSIGSGTF